MGSCVGGCVLLMNMHHLISCINSAVHIVFRGIDGDLIGPAETVRSWTIYLSNDIREMDTIPLLLYILYKTYIEYANLKTSR